METHPAVVLVVLRLGIVDGLMPMAMWAQLCRVCILHPVLKGHNSLAQDTGKAVDNTGLVALQVLPQQLSGLCRRTLQALGAELMCRS